MKKILLFFLFSIVTTAQSLDATFDSDGIVNSQIPNEGIGQQIFDGVLQPDGKMVYVGKFSDNSGFVSRYNSDGNRDITFNGFGFARFDYGTGLQTVSIQNDGKLLVAGGNIVIRLLSNGILDLSFDTIGYKIINPSPLQLNIKQISSNTDGTILISAFHTVSSTYQQSILVKLNSDGSYSSTFGSSGVKAYGTSGVSQRPFSHKVLSDGTILTTGERFDSTTNKYDFFVHKFNSNGSQVSSFGGNSNGRIICDFNNSDDYGRSIEVLSDGKMLVLGKSDNYFSLIKLNSNGTLDLSFGVNGKLILAKPISFSTSSLQTTLHNIPRLKKITNDKLLLSGTSLSDYCLIKTDSNGILETSFGVNGIVTLNNSFDYSTVLSVKSDDNIITGGYSSTGSTLMDKSYQIEYNSNGVSIANEIKTNYITYERFKNFQVLSDGKIICIKDSPQLSVLKYNSNGSLDTTFGNAGIVVLDQNPSIYPILKVQSDGKIIISDFYIYKLNPNGSLDTSFNGTGILDIDAITNHKMSHTDALFLTSDDKIILSCEYDMTLPNGSNTDYIFGLVKINQDGTVDTTYGTNGFFTTKIHPVVSEGAYDYANNILQQSDNKYLMVGISNTFTNGSYSSSTVFNSFVMQMNQNAVIDTSYGVNGLVYFPFIDNFSVLDAQLLPNDKLLLNFVSQNSSKTVKLNSNGSIDTTYGSNGTSIDIVGTKNFSMILQPDNKLIKAGKKNEQFSISRYNIDGSFDTSFGINGEISISSNWINSSISKILLQPDGKIIIGGNSFDGYSQLSTLVRLTNTVLGTLDFSSTKNPLSIYPNPIETTAIFDFTIENSENITIELYDVQGKLVQTIASNKQMASGNHNLPIKLNSNLTSGNYFLKLTTVNGSQSIQIIKK